MLTPLIQSEFLHRPALKNSLWYNGHTFSILIEAEQSGNTFVLIHCYYRKGGEPPAHYHKNEDETFYVLEGEVEFRIGEKHFTAQPGDVAFAPKEVPHHFSLVSETAKALLLITPAGFETFFKEFGTPAASLELPPIPEGEPPAVFINRMIARAEELGLVWTPEY